MSRSASIQALALAHGELVGLGEDNGERNVARSEPVDKLTVYFLLFVTYVDEHEDVDKFLTLKDIRADHAVKLFALSL